MSSRLTANTSSQYSKFYQHINQKQELRRGSSKPKRPIKFTKIKKTLQAIYQSDKKEPKAPRKKSSKSSKYKSIRLSTKCQKKMNTNHLRSIMSERILHKLSKNKSLGSMNLGKINQLLSGNSSKLGQSLRNKSRKSGRRKHKKHLKSQRSKSKSKSKKHSKSKSKSKSKKTKKSRLSIGRDSSKNANMRKSLLEKWGQKHSFVLDGNIGQRISQVLTKGKSTSNFLTQFKSARSRKSNKQSKHNSKSKSKVKRTRTISESFKLDPNQKFHHFSFKKRPIQSSQDLQKKLLPKRYKHSWGKSLFLALTDKKNITNKSLNKLSQNN